MQTASIIWNYEQWLVKFVSLFGVTVQAAKRVQKDEKWRRQMKE